MTPNLGALCFVAALISVGTALPAAPHDLPVAADPVGGGGGTEDPDRVDLVMLGIARQDHLAVGQPPVAWHGAAFSLALWDGRERAEARSKAIPFDVLVEGFDAGRPLHLFESSAGTPPPAGLRERVIWSDGRKWLLAVDAKEAAAWSGRGVAALPVRLLSREWTPRAPSVAFDCAFDPLVSELLRGSSLEQWLDWIERLSGVDPISVDGEVSTVETRYSSYMFSGEPTARAYDFALRQAEAWHYGPSRIEEHEYSGPGGQTWKNLVLTLPGETAPGEVVLLTGHLDSINLANLLDAPGANDNGTGSATLFEAARLMRQFRFSRTVKIIFFTGEEDGLYGSEAWVDDHSTSEILGVVNLDMFGWDGDGDRCFEIHAGVLPQSQDVADCFDASLSAYGLGLARDYLTTGATDRSDHASFWQVGVGAIEIAENFFNDGLPGGCVGQDANPGYHTSSDTIAQNMTPSYGFDIARAGLATIGAMAIPIETCFGEPPLLSADAGVGAVDLSWTAVAGADRYRVRRSSEGCHGQWFELGETTGTTWLDVGADEPTTYYYTVEAVASDGFCVSEQSNCAAATPTVYHASSVEIAVNDVCAGGGPGSGDGVVDPGESVLLPVTLQNDGNAALSDVEGSLSTATGGVSVIDPAAEWPDLPAGGAAPTLPNHFGFQVGPAVDCGTTLNAAVALDYAEGANDTGFTLPIGDPYEILLLDEDFSGGIPPGWTVSDGGSGGGAAATWTTANPGGRSIDPPFDSAFAIVDSDAAGSGASQDEILAAPPFDASGCRAAVLEFSSQFRWYSGSLDEIADVDLSTDGGVHWVNKLRIQGAHDGYTTPVTRSVDIASVLGGDLGNVRLRFHYHQAQYEWWWAIDNVRVRCTMLACTPCSETVGPPGEAGGSAPLTVRRQSGNLVLEWGAPQGACQADDFAVYRGELTGLGTTGYAHDDVLTCAAGAATLVIPESHPALGEADYYVVVSNNGIQEGSYGRDSDGRERPASASACLAAQNLLPCEP